MIGRTNGMQAARKTAPMMPPKSTAMADAPSARSPSPRKVIGYPSNTSARLFDEPGTLNRILVTESPHSVAMWAPSRSASVAATSLP